MRGAAMLEDKHTLPRAELQTAIGNRNYFAGTRQRHSNVRGRIIRAFGSVNEIVALFRNEPFEKFVQISARRTIGVFEDDKTRAGVLQENCRGAVLNFTLPDDSF